MEKQHLYPIPHSVKYNKLEVTTSEVDKPNESNKYSELLDIDSLGSSSVNDLKDESDSIINDLFDKNHILKARWSIMQQRIDKLKKENETLQKLLKDERIRTSKYQKKLHYIQENQPVFEKLKQAYMSLKYNEQKDRSHIEVNAIGCQTIVPYQDSPNVKGGPPSDFSLSRSIDDEITCEVQPGCMPIRKKTYNEMRKTVQEIKTLVISQPLSTFVISEKKEAKYRKDIADLFLENRSLKQLVVDQQIELGSIMEQISPGCRSLKQLVVDQQIELGSIKEQIPPGSSSKEISILKRIIGKVEKQIRTCKTCNSKIYLESVVLNETEKKIIGHISTRYGMKKHITQDRSLPESTVTSRTVSSITSRPVTPIISRPETSITSRPETPKTPRPVTPIISRPVTPIISRPETPITSRPETPKTPRPVTPKTPRSATPFYTPRHDARSDGPDTYRSCGDDSITTV